jgi:hypothetical protein
MELTDSVGFVSDGLWRNSSVTRLGSTFVEQHTDADIAYAK